MKEKSYTNNFFMMLKIAWHQNRYFIICQFVINILRGPFPLIIAYINKIIIDEITGLNFLGNENVFFTMVILVALTIVVQCSYEFFMTLDTKMSIISSNNIYKKFQVTILNKIKELDKEHFEKVKSKDIVYRGMNFDYEVIHSLIDSLSTMARRIFTAIVAAVILLKYSYILTVIVVLVCIPNLIIGKTLAKKSLKLTEELTILNRKKDYFSNILKSKEFVKEIKLFQSDVFFTNKYLSASKKNISLNKKFIITNLMLNAITDFLQVVVSGTVYGILILSAYTHQITIGDINFIKSAFDNLNTELYSSVSMIIKLYKDIASFDFFKQFTEIENKINIHDDSYKTINKDNGYKIEFKNVYFSYPESRRYALENISFIIDKGESVGLVGFNGSGKTTILNLLLRMYDCDKGGIYINDVNIKELDPFLYRAMWGVQQQDYYIYPLSIALNIAIGIEKNKIENEKLIEAAKKSDSMKFVQKLEQKFDTQIYKLFDHLGYEPSGGEKQKIALARLFYRRFEIYMLDEPSATIDSESENIIFNTIDKMLNNKTALVVTHRFSNLQFCNKIILLKDGKLVDIGTHGQLLGNSLYSTLYYEQANRYK